MHRFVSVRQFCYDVWPCFREKRELDRLQEQSRAAERERRATAWVKSSHPVDVHGDGRKMVAEAQQPQQQEQRRERERALIVDKGSLAVADAVNQHFHESLKHVEQKVMTARRDGVPYRGGPYYVRYRASSPKWPMIVCLAGQD